MRCPSCDSVNTRIYDSRPAGGDPRHEATSRLGAPVWDWWEPRGYRIRKRQCSVCEHQFVSIELELSDLKEAIKHLEEISNRRMLALRDLEIENTELRQLLNAG
mgnify:CR=1 FL=1